jgi:hypothetical protein
VERHGFEMLKQNSTLALHDGLGQTGCA